MKPAVAFERISEREEVLVAAQMMGSGWETIAAPVVAKMACEASLAAAYAEHPCGDWKKDDTPVAAQNVGEASLMVV